MASVHAKKFQVAFEQTLAKGARISQKDVALLERAARSIKDAKEKSAAGDVLALVKHDRILDKNEVEPARAALCRMLGVSTERLPSSLEQALARAVPVPNVRVAEYDLTFDLSKAAQGESQFPARARISLEKNAPSKVVLEIDPERIEIDEVRAGGRKVAFRSEHGRLYVDGASGAKSLDIKYRVRATGDTDSYGLIHDQHRGRMWTLTWPYNTGALFPSSSSPNDGATARVTVHVAPGEDVIGPGTPTKRGGETFALRDEVPAYAVAFTTGTFTDNGVSRRGPYEARTVGLGSSTPTSTRKAVREHVVEAMAFLSEWLGPYPHGKRLNIVEMDFDYGGMEHAGNIAVGVGQSKADTIEGAVHETVHHWFGDDVHIAHWGELWMSEGFTNYATFRFFRKRDGEAAFHKYLEAAKDELRDQLREGKSQPLQASAHTDPREGLSWVPYMHGVWMLRMIETQHGTPFIDRVMRDWYQAQQGTDVTTREFIDFVKQREGVDLAPFFKQWRELKTIPTVSDRSKIDGKRATLRLHAADDVARQLSVPVVVEGAKGQRATFLVKPGEPQAIEVDFKIKALKWDPERTLLLDVE